MGLIDGREEDPICGGLPGRSLRRAFPSRWLAGGAREAHGQWPAGRRLHHSEGFHGRELEEADFGGQLNASDVRVCRPDWQWTRLICLDP